MNTYKAVLVSNQYGQKVVVVKASFRRLAKSKVLRLTRKDEWFLVSLWRVKTPIDKKEN